MTNSSPWKDPPPLIGKSSINRPFSVAMLVITRWYIKIGTGTSPITKTSILQTGTDHVDTPWSVDESKKSAASDNDPCPSFPWLSPLPPAAKKYPGELTAEPTQAVIHGEGGRIIYQDLGE